MKARKFFFIIDDDKDDQLFLHEAVTGMAMPVDFLFADNGESALRLLKEEVMPVPDYIFLDLNMPRINGRECLIEIKKLPRYAGVPVVVYSTSSYQKDIQGIMELGAAYFLTKPTRITELCKHLKEIFSMNWQALRTKL